METFLGFLIMGSFVWLLFGLISPTRAIFWARKRTRGRVIGWYAIFFLVMGVALHIFIPQPPQPQAEQATPATEAAPAAASQPEEVPAKQPEPVAASATPSTPAVDAAKLAEEKAVKEKAEHAEIEQAQQAQARAREADKAKIRAFEKELHGYDAVSALFMENAKAMTRRLGKDASLGDLYQSLKQARQYAQAGANEVLKLRVPDVPEPVAAALKEAKEASWQMLLGRKDALDAFMDWLDSRKPSDQAKMQEESNFSTLQAAKSVEFLLKAKDRAGFTEEEIKADLKADSGEDVSQQAKHVRPQKRK
jgi:hypothetical protein